MNMNSGNTLASSLKTSQAFLAHRNFDQCHKYAMRAFQDDSTNPMTPRLLAVASALAAATRAGPPDWYAIVGLTSSTTDPLTIRARVDWMKDLVDPVKCPYPFAQEAYGWVLKAEQVLCDPELKARFDMASQNGGATFWTVCPYCYYMFEYQREYEGCALRCSNEACRKVFTGEAVAASAVPPPKVVDSGKYYCGGFHLTPAAIDDAAEINHGWNWWAPFMFSGFGSASDNVENGDHAGEKNSMKEKATVIDPSDGEEKEKSANGVKVSRTKGKEKKPANGTGVSGSKGKEKTPANGTGVSGSKGKEKTPANGSGVSGSKGKEKQASGTGVSGSEGDEKAANGAVKKMRKKVAAVAARKLTGKGVRVLGVPSFEEEEEVEVEFDEGDDDDIYVSLNPVVDDLGF